MAAPRPPEVQKHGSYRCPLCRERMTQVKDSRPTEEGYIRRRRYCESCASSFSTIEVPADKTTTPGEIHALSAQTSKAFTETVRHFNALNRAIRKAAKGA